MFRKITDKFCNVYLVLLYYILGNIMNDDWIYIWEDHKFIKFPFNLKQLILSCYINEIMFRLSLQLIVLMHLFEVKKWFSEAFSVIKVKIDNTFLFSQIQILHLAPAVHQRTAKWWQWLLTDIFVDGLGKSKIKKDELIKIMTEINVLRLDVTVDDLQSMQLWKSNL